MTAASFDALAQLLRLRQGPQREAARMVLVDGMRQADAARMAGCSASALGNTLRTCRAGLELARIAADAGGVAEVAANQKEKGPTRDAAGP